jgi:hypothetical protein
MLLAQSPIGLAGPFAILCYSGRNQQEDFPMNATEIQAVRETLRAFQDGYDRRDKSLLSDYRRLFIPEDDLEVIGTGAVEPGGDEWCLGLDAACSLVENDWEGWGDLRLDVDDARIHVEGEVAWLATTGTVTMDLDTNETYKDYLAYMKEVAEDDEMDPRDRMLEVLRGASNTFFEAERGEKYVWPLRFTAVLVRRLSAQNEGGAVGGNGTHKRWLFHQVQFSFATTRYPDVRNR